jgi:hypothetical protein
MYLLFAANDLLGGAVLGVRVLLHSLSLITDRLQPQTDTSALVDLLGLDLAHRIAFWLQTEGRSLEDYGTLRRGDPADDPPCCSKSWSRTRLNRPRV